MELNKEKSMSEILKKYTKLYFFYYVFSQFVWRDTPNFGHPNHVLTRFHGYFDVFDSMMAIVLVQQFKSHLSVRKL